MKVGMGLAAGAVAVTGMAGAASAQETSVANRTGARTVDGFGVFEAAGPVQRFDIPRRAAGPKDVVIETMYCGLCHSDIHTIRGEWGPIRAPLAPGHEIVGRVIGVGSDVTRFRVGDMAGVGCMVNSCGTCENCLQGLEQYCLNGATWTYGSPADVPGGYTQGGWSRGIVVTEDFVIRMPQSGDHAARAPLLCAGITTFSPLQHWKIEPGMRIGVNGIGGLGHMAVKLASAKRADVTMFTSTAEKVSDAGALGAREAVLTSDEAAMRAHARQYDLLISTIPQSYPVAPYLSLLGLDGTLVSVGTPLELQQTMGGSLWGQRRSIASSLIGGIPETQEVVDYCASHNISADIELIRPDQIDEAMNRVVGKQVRYRFVIDLQAA